RWAPLHRLRLADLLHPRALRHVDRHAEYYYEPGVRRRVRALSEAQGGYDRRRLCLAAGAHVAHGQALVADARGDAASEATAIGVCARACLVHHPTDRGAREPRAPLPDHGMDRLGPADVLDRLPALGLRRPDERIQDQAHG